jgi:hypothetical protein
MPSFVNRTIINWNQLPEDLLASFPCKLMYCVVYVVLYCVVLLYSVVLYFCFCTRVGLLPPGANPIAVKKIIIIILIPQDSALCDSCFPHGLVTKERIVAVP